MLPKKLDEIWRAQNIPAFLDMVSSVEFRHRKLPWIIFPWETFVTICPDTSVSPENNNDKIYYKTTSYFVGDSFEIEYSEKFNIQFSYWGMDGEK